MSKKTSLFFIFHLFVLITVNGQKQLAKAMELISNGEYAAGVAIYESYLVENPHDFNAMMKLGDAYRKYGQYGQSIFWFGSIPRDVVMPSAYYTEYGNVMKCVGRYHEAMEIFELQSKVDPIASGENIASTQFAIDALSAKAPYDFENLPLNSSESDVAISFYKDIPIYTSFRKDILLTEMQKQFNERTDAQRTYTFNLKNGKSNVIVAADGQINHIGPVSFSQNGSTCAYVYSKITDQWSYDYSNKSATLYIARLNDKGEITSAIPFDHNESISSINSACLAYDGQTIYFSSNRDGGFGGYDIYVSNFDDGKWSLPVNLGSEVNTSGDEITPFFIDGKIYFSSDRWSSIGGFDIQVTGVVDGVWTRASNPGAGFNTMGDDLFPYVSNNGSIYATSNRLGGKGGYDIYRIVAVAPPHDEIAEAEIPKAVSLDALEAEIAKHTKEGSNVSTVSNVTPSVKVISPATKDKVLPEQPQKESVVIKEIIKEENTSFEGAYRVGLSEALPVDEVFFIQLASISASKPNFTRFKSLVKYGNIYKMINNKSIKVRLGYFDSREEAEKILSYVRSNGYSDAFLTYEVLNTAKMELILSSSDERNFIDNGNFNSKSKDPQITNFNAKSKYKVRLASYEDPTWFDIEKVRDLGRVEQWTKGSWTIFVLAGYASLDEAKQAAIAASNRGFKTSEVVIDNGGILERLKQN
jgi:tetratricopeptide (TPR) repeat protein